MPAVPDTTEAGTPPEPGDPRRDWSAGRPPVLLHRRDGILPTTAAALSRPGAPARTATAARTGPVPRLHPLVRAVLDGLGADRRERHDGRCPEAALLSRRLTDAAAVDTAQARAALDGAGITTRHIREDGDPRHGQYARHCHSCTALLAHFGVRSVSPVTEATAALRLPRSEAGAGDAVGGADVAGAVGASGASGASAVAGPRGVGAAEAPRPDASEVLDQALSAAGWRPGRRHAPADDWAAVLRDHRSPQGHRHTVTPAAEAIWAEFGGLEIHPCGPGRRLVPAPVVIDPRRGLHWARTLGDLGTALGRRLSPLGEVGSPGTPGPGVDTALLAVDRSGDLYCLDHTGDWYLGPDLRTALATLLTGGAPVRLAAVGG